METLAATSVALALLAPVASAAAQGDPVFAHSASTYKEMAIFNHVVGDKRFVGNFMAAPGRCDVTVYQTRADDKALRLPLSRVVMPIAAGRRSVLNAGSESALAITCAAGANAIKIAPETDRVAR